MRVRPIRSARRRLSAERAAEVEVQLRARAEQLKPRGTPLGVCHSCAKIVYAGDSLAIAGGRLQHSDCPRGGPAHHLDP
jgi:hypothetical protein